MNRDNIFSEELKFKMWVIIENPQDSWWKKIDFQSGFLLSHTKLLQKKSAQPYEFQKLLTEINWPVQRYPTSDNWTLLGASQKLNTNWILSIHHPDKIKDSELLQIFQNLQIDSVRFFDPFKPSSSLISSLKHYDVVLG